MEPEEEEPPSEEEEEEAPPPLPRPMSNVEPEPEEVDLLSDIVGCFGGWLVGVWLVGLGWGGSWKLCSELVVGICVGR